MKPRVPVLLAALLLTLPAFAADAAKKSEQLRAQALKASTGPEHAEVAKQYRLRAEALDREAAANDARARDLAKGAGAMIHKWPAMANGFQSAKQKAAENRQAAAESRLLANRHINLAVESQTVSVD